MGLWADILYTLFVIFKIALIILIVKLILFVRRNSWADLFSLGKEKFKCAVNRALNETVYINRAAACVSLILYVIVAAYVHIKAFTFQFPLLVYKYGVNPSLYDSFDVFCMIVYSCSLLYIFVMLHVTFKGRCVYGLYVLGFIIFFFRLIFMEGLSALPVLIFLAARSNDCEYELSISQRVWLGALLAVYILLLVFTAKVTYYMPYLLDYNNAIRYMGPLDFSWIYINPAFIGLVIYYINKGKKPVAWISVSVLTILFWILFVEYGVLLGILIGVMLLVAHRWDYDKI